MNKPKFETPDMVEKNIEKLAEIFPNCITEARDENGKLKKAVNFEMLQQILSTEFPPEGSPERYEFTWVGKRAAIAEANKPIRKTLRPYKAESKNWDTTENLYIEGDNLEVLKLLQESYLGKVKMIYIDPPYNTGNDFIYRDDFKQTQQEYDEQVGLFDEDEKRLFKNTETNGRFHSDWCSMMYSRLMLAKNFLSDDGAVFIHIDEHEVCNLQKICNEIFGEVNELGTIIWDKRNPKGFVFGIAYQHESILVYAKNINVFVTEPFKKKKENAEFIIEKAKQLINSFGEINDNVRKIFKKWINEQSNFSGGEKAYCLIDDNGKVYRQVSMAAPDKPETRSHRALLHPLTGKACPVPEKGWRFTDKKLDELLTDGKIEFGVDESVQPRQKYYLDENLYEAVSSIIYYGGTGNPMDVPFDNSKPVIIAKELIFDLCKNKNDVIMDFFSGSATTAHAVMQLNAEDDGHRKFIMVQLPEVCDEKSDAYKAGYKNICEIGKERIRRAGEKIKADNPLTTQDLDIGFRVFKVDSSNMNDVYYSAGEYSQDMLVNLEDNIKPDRTDLDLLFGCLLDWGLPISLPYTSEQIENYTVHTYNEGDLIACFDENIPESVIKEIAKRKPMRAVFRDAGFGSSPEKINVTEIFKMLAPDTDIKVI